MPKDIPPPPPGFVPESEVPPPPPGFVPESELQQQSDFGARLEADIRDVPRQLGLTARYAIEEPAEFASIFTNPITYGLERLTGRDIMTTAELGRWLADMAGLPRPETSSERIAAEGAKIAIPVAGQAAVAARVARAAGSMMQRVLQKLAEAPAAQVAGAATGGVAGGYARETGAGPVGQAVAAMAGGVAGAAAPGLARQAARGIESGVRRLLASLRGTQSDIAQINERLGQMLAREGVDISAIPVAVRNQMARELKDALDVGGEIDPVVARRIADYARVGAVPTRGTVTLDPVQITQEKNLAKYGANSADERLQALARRQRENDRILVENLNEMGAAGATDEVTAGQKIKTALKLVDAPRKEAVDRAYQSVRDARGRYANLDVPYFSNLANDRLDQEMLGSVLPNEVRKLLNDVSAGRIPLNVNTVAQLDRRLSAARYKALANGDKDAALAVQVVREALWETPPESAAGEAALEAYHHARQLAASRFRAIENNPAMRAALDDADPDKFVQQFILGRGKQASFRNVRALVHDLKKVPEAYEAARQQILHYLKYKALSGAPDEAGNFSPARFRQAMDSIGRKKLSLFFTKKELDQLEAIRRVATYEKYQPTGSAVNNSNTAAQVLNTLIERVGEGAITAKIPVIRVLGSIIADQKRNMLAKKMAKESLDVRFTKRPRLETPPATSVVLPAASGIAAGPTEQ